MAAKFTGAGEGVAVSKLKRWSLRTTMVAIAVVALALGYLARPYPFMVSGYGAVFAMRWTDGSMTGGIYSEIRHAKSWREGRLITGVDWSDGGTSWHFTRKPKWPPAQTR